MKNNVKVEMIERIVKSFKERFWYSCVVNSRLVHKEITSGRIHELNMDFHHELEGFQDAMFAVRGELMSIEFKECLKNFDEFMELTQRTKWAVFNRDHK